MKNTNESSQSAAETFLVTAENQPELTSFYVTMTVLFAAALLTAFLR
jgi:hypothetical protein